MNEFKTYHSNTDIRNEILHGTHTWNAKEMIYLVMGKGGPTGKTWLVYQLRGAGLRAIDVTEDAFEFVISRRCSGNYMKVDEANKVVYISLNDINDIYLQNNDCML